MYSPFRHFAKNVNQIFSTISGAIAEMGYIPQGTRFSHVYLHRPDQLEDSKKMRRRLGAMMYRNSDSTWPSFIFSEIGLHPVNLQDIESWMNFYINIDLCDLLDSITIICIKIKKDMDLFEYLGLNSCNKLKNKFYVIISETRRIFAEERVRYSIDDSGGVHLAVDQQFELAKAAAVQGMDDPRYAKALQRLEDGYRALDRIPSDGRKAVQGVLGATESLFQQTFGMPKINLFTGQLIDQKLKLAIAMLPWDRAAIAAANAMADALKHWVAASHEYRYEAGHPDLHQPPPDLAILMVTQGTNFARWLVKMDKVFIEFSNNKNI